MFRVEIFRTFTFDTQELKKDINTWLDQNSDRIVDPQFHQSESNSGLTISIFYRVVPKLTTPLRPTPPYEPAVEAQGPGF